MLAMIPVSCDDKRIKKNLHYDNKYPFPFFNTTDVAEFVRQVW